MMRMSAVTDVTVALVVMLAAIGMPGTAWAQAPVTSFDQVPTRVKIGDTVSVTDTAGAEQKGKVVLLLPTALTLTVDGTPRDFPAARVSTIKRHQRASLRKGTLIGLGAGAAVGVLRGATSCDSGDGLGPGGCALIVGGIFGGIGAAAGVGVAALIPGKKVLVYRAPSSPSAGRISIAPILLPTCQGLAIRVSF